MSDAAHRLERQQFLAEQALKASPLRRGLRLLGYYKYNIIFPSIVGFFIWADWSHTRDWKLQQKQLAAEQQQQQPQGN